MSELKMIEELIKKEKVIVGLADSLKKLKTNRDFKKIFLDYYGKEYAASLVRGKADAMIQNKESQAYVDNQINAISHLFQFMDITLIQGDTAAENILQHEVERNAILRET